MVVRERKKKFLISIIWMLTFHWGQSQRCMAIFVLMWFVRVSRLTQCNSHGCHISILMHAHTDKHTHTLRLCCVWWEPPGGCCWAVKVGWMKKLPCIAKGSGEIPPKWHTHNHTHTQRDCQHTVCMCTHLEMQKFKYTCMNVNTHKFETNTNAVQTHNTRTFRQPNTQKYTFTKGLFALPLWETETALGPSAKEHLSLITAKCPEISI